VDERLRPKWGSLLGGLEQGKGLHVGRIHGGEPVASCTSNEGGNGEGSRARLGTRQVDEKEGGGGGRAARRVAGGGGQRVAQRGAWEQGKKGVQLGVGWLFGPDPMNSDIFIYSKNFKRLNWN
jgi:hypothetical protein